MATSRKAIGLTTQKLLAGFDTDSDSGSEDLSDDGEELLGDYCDDTGKQGLVYLGPEGFEHTLDPCFRDSLLLVGASLPEVRVHVVHAIQSPV